MPTVIKAEHTFGRYGGDGVTTSFTLGRNGTLQHQFTTDVATGRTLETISVQIIDAYGYQREWFIGQQRVSGGHEIKWMSHAYRHPGLRCEQEMTRGVAKRLMAMVLEITRDYPIILWNETNEGVMGACAGGFVHLHDKLLQGTAPSVELMG